MVVTDPGLWRERGAARLRGRRDLAQLGAFVGRGT